MGIQPVYSTKESAKAAVQDIQQQANEKKPKAVVFFASSHFDPSALGSAMKTAFNGATCIGCTTAGEIVSGKMLTNSVVAMIIGDDIIEEMCVKIVDNVKTEDRIPATFEYFNRHFNTSMSELDIEKYVGLIFTDGMSGAEEKLMDTIGNLTNVTFIGGSAGDDLKFKEAFVYADGKASSNAAVLGLMKLKKGFDIIKSQSFCSMNKTLKATVVNEAERRVVSFNGMPATKAYAEALGCSEEEAANKFMSNPLGLMIDGEPYIRSPQQFDGKDILFYCKIKEGMELDVMEATNIVEDTRKAVVQKIKGLGQVSGIIDFHCILRALELRQKNLCDAYGSIYKDLPAIGYCTYGESYIGHINQTSTMLVFK